MSVPNQASPRTDLPLRDTGGLNGFLTGDLTVDTATDRLVVSTPRIYHLLVRVQWDDVNPGDGSPGRRQIVFTRQFGSTGAGANNIGTITAEGGTDPVQIGSWYAALGAGDRVSVDVTQETGGTQSVTAGSRLALVWVAPR